MHQLEPSVKWRDYDLNFNTVTNGSISLFVLSTIEDYFIYVY